MPRPDIFPETESADIAVIRIGVNVFKKSTDNMIPVIPLPDPCRGLNHPGPVKDLNFRVMDPGHGAGFSGIDSKMAVLRHLYFQPLNSVNKQVVNFSGFVMILRQLPGKIRV